MRNRGFIKYIRKTGDKWLLLCLIIWACYSLSHRLKRSATQNVSLRDSGEVDFARVDKNELQRALLLRTWPILQGYDGRDVSEETHPNDTLLLERIDSSMRAIKQPLVRIIKAGLVLERHPWKFEKIIHQTWISKSLPNQTGPWVSTWLRLNPDWTYMFWTDDTAREFVKQYFSTLLPVYDSWTLPVQKADMFRYIALYAFGGIYADLDMEALRPLDGIRDWSSCILSREPDLQTYVMVNDLNAWCNNYTFTCNAFMACHSHHPFLHYLISRVIRQSPFVTKKPCTLDQTLGCTGPFLVSVAYAFYRRSISDEIRSQRPETELYCPKYEWFLPTFDESRVGTLHKNCKQEYRKTDKQHEACHIWEQRGKSNSPMDYSYTTHHWFHSYSNNVTQTEVHIDTLTNSTVWSPNDSQFDMVYL